MNILQIILIIVISAAVIGYVYQTVATRRDKYCFRPPGQLVDNDARRLHLNAKIVRVLDAVCTGITLTEVAEEQLQ